MTDAPAPQPPRQMMPVQPTLVHMQVEPVGGGVGRSEDGRTILAFDCVVMLKLEVVLPEEAKRGIQRGLVGIDVASPSDLARETAAHDTRSTR